MYKALIKMRNKKGFTLMELLIVVAIIAILAAIAIPTFASSLDKARTAADEANGRSLYAAVAMSYITEDGNTPPLTADIDGAGPYTIEFAATVYTFNTKPAIVETATTWTITAGDKDFILAKN